MPDGTIALVHLVGDPSVAYGAPYESARLGSIAARLRRGGFDVDLVDTGFEPLDGVALVERLSAARLVVIDALFRTAASALRLADRLPPSQRVILVGDAVRSCGVEVLSTEPAIDAVVVGDDAPTAVFELASTETWDEHPDVVVRGADGFVSAAAQSFQRAVDTPPPERRHANQAIQYRPVLDVATSQGCSSRCAFCIVGSAGRTDAPSPRTSRWSPRPAEDVASEIRGLIDEYGVRRFHFSDDNFIGVQRHGQQRAHELADLLAPLDIAFSFYCRADAVEVGLFTELRKAGLRQVHLGIEAGCDATLKRLHKDQDVAAVEAALEALRSLDVRVVPSFMTFEARQSLSELMESLSWMRDTGTTAGFSLNGSVPLPGTLMLAELLQEGLVQRAPHFRQAFELVNFRDPSVAQVARAMRAFESEIDARRTDHGATSLASEYHRYNDHLEIARPGPTPASLARHDELRSVEVDLAIAVGAEVAVGVDANVIGDLIDTGVQQWCQHDERKEL